jgi:hypothetical protein
MLPTAGSAPLTEREALVEERLILTTEYSSVTPGAEQTGDPFCHKV